MLALLLAACALAPVATGDHSDGQGEIRSFDLSGRLALRQPDRSDVLQLAWQHQPGFDRIALSTPLGSQVMLLEERPGRAVLTLPDRAPVVAADDAALMQSLIGYTLPVHGLADWVLGHVPAGADPANFTQDGWTGSLQRWRPVGEDALPGLLVVSRDGLTLRLVVDQWRVQRGAS